MKEKMNYLNILILTIFCLTKVQCIVTTVSSCDDIAAYSKVMVVAAHPDDIETIAGGTVWLFIQCNKKISYVITTNGDKGWSKDYEMTSEELSVIRENEARSAALVLNVTDLTFMHQEDGRLESVDAVELKKNITKAIRTFQPDLVLTFSSELDYSTYPFGVMHADHQRTGQATLNAVWPAARDYLSFVDLFDEGYMPWNTPEVWLFHFSNSESHRASPHTVTTVFIMPTATFEKKYAALLEHQSQYTNATEVKQSLLQLGSFVAENFGMGPGAVAEAFLSVKIL